MNRHVHPLFRTLLNAQMSPQLAGALTDLGSSINARNIRDDEKALADIIAAGNQLVEQAEALLAEIADDTRPDYVATVATNKLARARDMLRGLVQEAAGLMRETAKLREREGRPASFLQSVFEELSDQC